MPLTRLMLPSILSLIHSHILSLLQKVYLLFHNWNASVGGEYACTECYYTVEVFPNCLQQRFSPWKLSCVSSHIATSSIFKRIEFNENYNQEFTSNLHCSFQIVAKMKEIPANDGCICYGHFGPYLLLPCGKWNLKLEEKKERRRKKQEREMNGIASD